MGNIMVTHESCGSMHLSRFRSACHIDSAYHMRFVRNAYNLPYYVIELAEITDVAANSRNDYVKSQSD
jgi:hypothetical protein